jgi:hypothetical protein
MNVSFAFVPSSVIVCRLTSLFLTFALAASSAALLCSGTSVKPVLSVDVPCSL